MWWDPSITIDSTFMELVPTLNCFDLQEFPVQSKRIRQLAIQSMDQMNILGLIGCTKLLHIKNEVVHLGKQFEIVHLAYLQRIFFMISEKKMNREKERLLHFYGRLVFQRWFSDVNEVKLQKLLVALKKTINRLEKYTRNLGYKTDQIQQSNQILKVIHFEFEDAVTRDDHQHFQQKFKGHVEYIYKNKKQMIFLNFLYEVKYMLVGYLFKDQFYLDPKQLINIINGQLFYLSTNPRLSYSIQNMAFVLNKIFLMNTLIDKDKYDDLRNIIACHIQQFQLTQQNLTGKTQYFSFHMKQCNYFDYLEQILMPKGGRFVERLNEWKQKIRKAVLLNSFQNVKPTTLVGCNEAIFYMQLRPRQAYLWGEAAKINDFPDIDSQVILRMIVSSQMRNLQGSQNMCAYFVTIVINHSENEVIQIYKNFNLLERGIFVYYLIYFKAMRAMMQHRELNQYKAVQINDSIRRFLNNLKNQDILELVHFYIFQIRLGNYYRSSKKDSKMADNSVNYHLYSQFIALLHQRIKNSLICYKELKSTLDLKYISLFTKYLVVLIRCTSLDKQANLVCPCCIKISNLDNCPRCHKILLGLQLQTDRSIYFVSNDPYIYREMINGLFEKAKSILSSLFSLLVDNSAEWLRMLALVLQELLQNIDYL